MSSVLDQKKCEQCGYEFGFFEFYCRSRASAFICRRCGYCEFFEMITDDEGDCTGWRHDTHHGYGAYWCVQPGKDGAEFGGLHSDRQLDECAPKIRELIAKGDLDGDRSYVTRWNAEEECVEVIVGRWTKLDYEDHCVILEKSTGEGDS
jgi:hypothetical protein